MKFIDYYEVLEISKSATSEEIKRAFWRQAKKCHPDLNIGIDVTQKMQLLNEAYLILKDVDARARYDEEYDKFYNYQNSRSKSTLYSDLGNEEYQFSDKTLERWIWNAKKQAIELAKQTLKEIIALSIDATKAAGKEMGSVLLKYVIAGLIIFMVVFIANNQTISFREMILYMFRIIIGIAVILFFIRIATIEDEN